MQRAIRYLPRVIPFTRHIWRQRSIPCAFSRVVSLPYRAFSSSPSTGDAQKLDFSLVTVKPSGRPNAGRGVFACRDIAEGQLITTFSHHNASPKVPNTDYSVTLSTGVKLFGKEQPEVGGEGVCQLINDYGSLTEEHLENLGKHAQQYLLQFEHANAVYRYHADSVAAVATRPIAAGEEIFIAYGLHWWLSRLGAKLYFVEGKRKEARYVEAVCEKLWGPQQKLLDALFPNLAPSFGAFTPFLPPILALTEEGAVLNTRSGKPATQEDCIFVLRADGYGRYLSQGVDPLRLAGDLLLMHKQAEKTQQTPANIPTPNTNP